MHTMRQSGSDRTRGLFRVHGRNGRPGNPQPRGTKETRRMYSMRKPYYGAIASLSKVLGSITYAWKRNPGSEKIGCDGALRQGWKSRLLLAGMPNFRSRHAHVGSCCKQRGSASQRVFKDRTRRRNGALLDARKAGLSFGLSNALLQPQLEKAFVGNQI